jgi:putative phosphoesterase
LKLIGIISDTHIPARARALPSAVFSVFQDAARIIHAGDLTRLSVIEELEQMAPVVSVHGNMDSKDVKETLPALNAVHVYGWKIGVTHSLGFFLRRRKLRDLSAQGFQVFVSGHTHRPTVKHKEGMPLINPGSATDPIPPFLTKPSVALLRVTKTEIEPEIVTL